MIVFRLSRFIIGCSLLMLPVATYLTVVEERPIYAQTQTPNEYTGVAKQVDEIAEKITVLINSKNNGNGSGTIVAKEGNTYYVLTAAHVVKNSDDYTLTAPDGQQYQLDRSQMTVLEEVDLAVVQFTSEKTYSVAILARYNLKDNFWVFVSGFPKSNGGEQRRTDGALYGEATSPSAPPEVPQLVPAPRPPQRWLTAGKVWQEEQADFATKDQYSLNSGGRGLIYTSLSMSGMSGGPVLDSRGYVVGINTAAENELEVTSDGQAVEISLGFSLGVPIGTFVSLAQKAKIQSQTLQVKTTTPPDLTEIEVKSIVDSLMNAKVPDAGVGALDWLNYGNQLWRFGRDEEAAIAFEQAIALQPDFYQAYYGKGLALWREGKFGEALTAFEQATKLASNFTPAWRYQGATLGKLKKYAEALAAYDKAIELAPNNFVLHVERGDILRKLKRFTEAVAAYHEALKLKTHPWAYGNRGIAYADLQQYQSAIADYDRAIALNPDDPIDYTNRGIAYYSLKQYKQAIADFNRAISLNSNYAVAYYNRALVYTDLKEYQKALADYDRAISLAPDFAEAYGNRGNIYTKLQQYQKAIDDFNRAISLNRHDFYSYDNRGVAYAYLQQYQQAISDFNRAIALNPEFANAYYDRGLTYFNLQQYQTAIADFDRAIKIDPDLAEAYSNRGLAYFSLNQHRQAISDFNKAIAIQPDAGEAYLGRGLAYIQLEERENAIADLEQATQLFCQQGSPKCQPLQEFLRQLQQRGN